jgi:hypothetical protein
MVSGYRGMVARARVYRDGLRVGLPYPLRTTVRSNACSTSRTYVRSNVCAMGGRSTVCSNRTYARAGPSSPGRAARLG